MRNPTGNRFARTARLLAPGVSVAIVLSASGTGWSQTRITNESVREQDLSAQSSAMHHYNSPAERAEDDLLIVKVKAAIAGEGLADNYPLTVDSDHGRVTLTGVLASRRDVERAVALVSSINGVKGVNNRLTWEKNRR
jgi:hyperosmotically inducible periplasmic protein